MAPSPGGLYMISLNTRLVRITLVRSRGPGRNSTGNDQALQRPVLSWWRTRTRWTRSGFTNWAGMVMKSLKVLSSGESQAASYSRRSWSGLVTAVPGASTSAMRHCMAAKVPAPWGSANGED